MDIQDIAINEIWFDYTRNVRLEGSYKDCEPNPQFRPNDETGKSTHKPGLYEDILANGLLTPIDVALLEGSELEQAKKRAIEQGFEHAETIRYRGIRGHRRFRAITEIRKTETHLFKMVPCVVHTGLTALQEMDLLVDHFGIRTLNQIEVLNAVKILLMEGLSELEIARRIQMSRGFVQRRQWILSMPQFVRDAWTNYITDAKGDDVVKINLTDNVLRELYKAAGKDRHNNTPLDSEDSEFMQVWNEVSTGKPKQNAKKAMSLNDVKKFLATLPDLDPIIADVLKFGAQDGTVSLVPIDKELKTLRAKAAEFEKLKREQRKTVTAAK